MDLNKSFLTVDEQIEHLKNKGVRIPSDEGVRNKLESASYYSIVNGYSDPFRFPSDRKKYLKDVSFSEIYALYQFDKIIRTMSFSYLLEAESKLKNDIVYAFLSQKNPDGSLTNPNDAYLKISSYDNSNYQSSINCIASFERIIGDYLGKSDAIRHYLTHYSFVPLWVLETKMTFGNLIHFYQNLKPYVRIAVSKKYNMSDNDLLTFMKIISLGRNCVAHKDRFYCIKHIFVLPTLNASRHQIAQSFISQNEGNKNFFSIIIALGLVIGQKAIKPLLNCINDEMLKLSKKLKCIPPDSISKEMGLPKDWYEQCTKKLVSSSKGGAEPLPW